MKPIKMYPNPNQPVLKILLLSLLVSLSACNSKEKAPMETSEEVVQIPEFSMAYDQKIDSLIALMTLEEKVGMLHGNSMFTTTGVERLGIPELKMADGPLGIREELNRDSWAPLGLDTDYATFFPAGGGLSATWNPELAESYGKSIGAEARARNKDVLLAPAINIIRTPVGGRTFEYFSEDPFLNKMIAVPYVTGVQSQDVAVCVKHYAVNNQETNRGTVDVQMDERTLREIYLPAFKATIDANAYTVMGAYNKFRGDFLCENDYMLNTILKGEWGFKGLVISDWGAVHSSVKTIRNGMDIEMGSDLPFDEFFLAQPLLDSIKAGKMAEEELNGSIKRILRVMYNVKSIASTNRVKGSINTPEHLKTAYDIASESIVLLKNTKNILPLNASVLKSIAIIGDNAKRKHAAGGFGAGVKTKTETSPFDGLQNRLGDAVTLNFAQGYTEIYADQNTSASFGREISQNIDQKLINEAVEAAKKSDVAIVFAGSNRSVESEAADRKDLQLPFGQEKLIQAVEAANPNTIVVIIAGGPFDLKQVETTTSALIWSWFNGSEGGNALADVILGKINPSGKLPWTLPKNLSDSPAHATHSFPGDSVVVYKEGILVGYRWFDTKNIEPLYPFGYGLSYTSFEISDFQTNKQEYNIQDTIKVNFKLHNTGITEGKEVVQLYVSDPESSVLKAEKELKGFVKLNIAENSAKNASITLLASDLAYYNVEQKKWIVEPGEYIIKLGFSSRDIKQELRIIIY